MIRSICRFTLPPWLSLVWIGFVIFNLSCLNNESRSEVSDKQPKNARAYPKTSLSNIKAQVK